MDDAVHDGVGVDPAAEPGVPVLLAELCAEDRGGRAVAGLHELEQEAPEELVGAVEQPLVEHEDLEGRVLPRDLALAAGALARLAPELLQVGAPDVAGPHPPLAGGLGDRAGQVGLARAGGPLQHHALAALGEAAGGELGDQQPVQAALLREVYGADVGLRVPQVGALGEVSDLGRDEGRVGLVDGHLHPLGAGHAHAQALVLGIEGVQQVGGAHVAQLALRLH